VLLPASVAYLSSASIGLVLPGPQPGHPLTRASWGGTGAGPSIDSVLAYVRSVVVAATDAFHGAVWATLPASGPVLPAEAATKIPAPKASRNARLTELDHGASAPLME
jgi:hypothetical protein